MWWVGECVYSVYVQCVCMTDVNVGTYTGHHLSKGAKYRKGKGCQKIFAYSNLVNLRNVSYGSFDVCFELL